MATFKMIPKTKRYRAPKGILLFIVLALGLSNAAVARAKYDVKMRLDANKFTEAQLSNNTIRDLACYVAIDGYKRKFRLPARTSSRWFKATDVRYKHTDFRIWCDFLDYHPQYQKYGDSISF